MAVSLGVVFVHQGHSFQQLFLAEAFSAILALKGLPVSPHDEAHLSCPVSLHIARCRHDSPTTIAGLSEYLRWEVPEDERATVKPELLASRLRWNCSISCRVIQALPSDNS